MAEQTLVKSLAEKVLETIERTDHLVLLVPANLLEWRPELPSQSALPNNFGSLLGHLLDCLAGFCAVFYRAFPEELADFQKLRSSSINESCLPLNARARITFYAAQIDRGFQRCKDEDLGTRIPTIFVPEGETLLTILLGNLEHLINHKYQLFFYLKLAGVPVGSRDIYRWRGASGSDRQATEEPK
jgi:hypothetical protein